MSSICRIVMVKGIFILKGCIVAANEPLTVSIRLLAIVEVLRAKSTTATQIAEATDVAALYTQTLHFVALIEQPNSGGYRGQIRHWLGHRHTNLHHAHDVPHCEESSCRRSSS